MVYIPHELRCRDLITFTIISTPLCVVYLYDIGGWESQGNSCSIQPTDIYYCTWQWMAHLVLIAPADTAVIGSSCPGVMWRHM